MFGFPRHLKGVPGGGGGGGLLFYGRVTVKEYCSVMSRTILPEKILVGVGDGVQVLPECNLTSFPAYVLEVPGETNSLV